MSTAPAWISGDGDPTHALAWGDVDLDGDLDLAIGREGFVGVYINQNGTLRPTATEISPVDGAVSALAWGDMNGDGALDLVVGTKLIPQGGRVQVFLNAGKTLLPTAAWEIVLDSVTGVALGDVDNNGALDLAVSSSAGAGLYLNAGDMLSNAPAWSAVETNSLGIAWGDSDGDNDLDLLVYGEAHYDTGSDTYLTQVSLYLNEAGALAGTPAWRPADFAGGWHTAKSAAWADVDQDGDLDLAVGYIDAHNVTNRLYRNQGGTLETTASWVATESNDIAAIVWGDMNSDGYPDLIVSHDWAAGHVYVNVGGTLATTPAWGAAQGNYSPAAAPGDVDNDGDLDLAVADQGANMLYENIGVTLIRAGGWRSETPNPARDVAWGDVDNDGDLDLAISGSGESLYLNENGRLAPTPAWTADSAAQAHSVAWGDVDGDGDLDLAVGVGGNSGSGYSVARLYVNEAGALAATAAWTAESAAGIPTHFEVVAWGDVDNDGDLDLAVGYLNTNMVLTYRVYLNAGAGLNPTAEWEVTLPNYVISGDDHGVDMAWGDVNDDGALDLAVIDNALSVSLYLNRGGRLATEPDWIAADSGYAWGLAWGDVDGDGDLDLAVGNAGQPNKLYYNNGGTLQNTAGWASGDADFTTSIAWADVNGDGLLDLATGGDGQPTKVYLNARGALGKVAAWTSTDTSAAVRASLAWGDVDGDGDLDLAVGDTYLRVYANTRDTQASAFPHPIVSLDQPGNTAQADFYADPAILAQPTLPIPYTLCAPYAGTIARVQGYYAINGGGYWWPAKPTADTQITNLPLSTEAVSVTAPVQQRVEASANTKTPIPDNGNVAAYLTITQSATILDVNVWVAITHPRDGDLQISLQSPTDEVVKLVEKRGGYGDDFAHTMFDDEAFTSIREGVAPFADCYLPEEALARFDGSNVSGDWGLLISDVNPANTGLLSAWGLQFTLDTGAVYTYTEMLPAVYTYTWDVQGSGLFGKSDNVVFRLEAIPASAPITGAVAGPYLYGAYASETSPFRVRGSQVRVLSATLPIANALVFHQTSGMAKLTPYADAYGEPLRTDSQGYLQGRERLKSGDRLVALAATAPPLTTPVVLNEDFEGAVFPPPGWTQFEDGAADNPGWQLQWGDAQEGMQSAAHYALDTEGRAYSWLVTPRISVPPGGQLRFWQADDYNLLERYWYHGVWITTDAPPDPNTADYVELWSGDAAVDWTQQQVDLSTYSGRDVYIAFLYEGDYADTWYIDNVSVQASDADVAQYTLYHTSAAPTLTGLAAYTVTTLGVQTLTVSPAYPLLLFNLNISLEWDARQDTPFLNQLKFDLGRASELLYDASNGQIALGKIQLYHNKARWDTADIQLHASNTLIPNADVGGIVTEKTTRQIIANPFAIPSQTLPYTLTYLPGAVRMGTVWGRYGEEGSVPGDDWPRALVHELGHHLFYLYDNYVGLDTAGALIPVSTCGNSIMSNAYEYNEFRDATAWGAECGVTLSARRNGRSDWDTITGFYPQLRVGAAPGPVALPLDVTQIQEVPVSGGGLPLSEFIFTLTDAYGAALQPGPHAQAMLYQGDRVIDLGRPEINKVTARGARAGDRLCVYELDAQPPRWGCERLTSGDATLALVPRANWQPEIRVTPWTTATVVVTVTHVPAGLPLRGRVYPGNGRATAPQALTAAGDSYTASFTLPDPDTQATIYIWVDEAEAETAPRREAVTSYAIGGSANRSKPCNPPPCRSAAGDCNTVEENFLPAISPDGQVLLYAPRSSSHGFYTLQKATRLPAPLPWSTVVGSGYYVLQSRLAPTLAEASINFRYRRQDVPPGEEAFLALYYWQDNAWVKLPTTRHPAYNEITAPAQGSGLYALMSSLEIPLPTVGWNLVSYPVQETRTVTNALASIKGSYGLVYGYDTADTADPWKVYTPPLTETLMWANDLHTLRFGQGYWISVTRPITWELKGNPAGLARQAPTLITPPATYYGRILAGADFTPTAGEPITAYVDERPCSYGRTFTVGDDIVYSLNVGYTPATGPCGAAGQPVTFQVGAIMMDTTAAWNNDRVWPLDLVAAETPAHYHVYLPLVMKEN